MIANDNSILHNIIIIILKNMLAKIHLYGALKEFKEERRYIILAQFKIYVNGCIKLVMKNIFKVISSNSWVLYPNHVSEHESMKSSSLLLLIDFYS